MLLPGPWSVLVGERTEKKSCCGNPSCEIGPDFDATGATTGFALVSSGPDRKLGPRGCRGSSDDEDAGCGGGDGCTDGCGDGCFDLSTGCDRRECFEEVESGEL